MVTCSCCGSKTTEPDPEINRLRPLERIQFEKDWDRRYEEGNKKK